LLASLRVKTIDIGTHSKSLEENIAMVKSNHRNDQVESS